MLYLNNQNQAYIYTAAPVGEMFFDLYNFCSMNRNEEAVQGIVRWEIEQFQLRGIQPNAAARYTLVLDFLANARTPRMTAVIARLQAFMVNQRFTPVVNEVPLRVSISDLRIEDVLNIIQNNEFQTINGAIANLGCSTWRLSIQN